MLPSPPPAPTPEALELATLKRKYVVLEAENDLIKGKGNKRQINTGRSLSRVVDLFFGPRELVQEADRRIEHLTAGGEAVFSAEQEARYKSYLELVNQVPLLKHLLEQGESEPVQVLLRNTQLKKGSDNARSDDTAKLKAAIVPWVDAAFGTSTPPLRSDSKFERGLDNDITGRLLCPGEYSWDDSITRNNIREGHESYLVTAHSWPLFLYEDYTCDIEDVQKGLLKSPMLVKAFKYLFTSPSSASEDHTDAPRPAKRAKNKHGATRTNVAGLIGLKNVTPRSIAYVAVQLRFALSNTTSWRLVDIDFSQVEFYGAIVDFFESTPGPRTQANAEKLLAWWNMQIFGRGNGASKASELARRHASSSMSRMASQRQALEDAE
ncbi:hypothetical protein HWV62_16384 [Athelia sp. TMB]|nr:hypothetical protein HWV62_16384 [Athelia sp. TMB]